MIKILIVEDEEALCNSILTYLSKETYLCTRAISFKEAEDRIYEMEFDIFVLDLNLPDGDGLDLLKIIRKKDYNPGVIILTARDSINERTRGLDLGADDYITKPFHIAELNSRIKSLIRRLKFEGSNEVVFDLINVNLAQKQVEINNQILDLTKTEYDVLLYFISNKERVITKESLVEYIWGDWMDAFDSLDFVYTHIRNLRKKIKEAGGKDYIQTVYGIGYRLQVP
jgi:DNA-binding response OmpR family regulator